ncbi:hypothetical protein RHGRI_021269 [Rhododendron griersonianum]|uniref:Uncharacterized protein n=1 Tax=Rhododendron griersonianum TaxID=479676 RepID=A0AAV6JP24_9ERIC|nr:hypothetical protein RHGRI_021269 [Rhododendron griersonianum]
MILVVAQGATTEKRCKVVLNQRYYCDLPSCGYMCDVLYNGTPVCSSPTVCLCIPL